MNYIRSGYSHLDYLGLELDEVLEGLTVLPVQFAADRASQVVTLPPLSATERLAEARRQQDQEARSRRACADAVAVLDRLGEIDRGERVVRFSDRYQAYLARRKAEAQQRVRDAMARYEAERRGGSRAA